MGLLWQLSSGHKGRMTRKEGRTEPRMPPMDADEEPLNGSGIAEMQSM